MIFHALQQHASILLVVLPLLAAPVTALLPDGRLSWGVTMAVTSLCLLLAVQIFIDVSSGSLIHYELGGWAPPWGIAYRIDALNALLALIITIVGFMVIIYAWDSVKRDIPKQKHSLFYAAFQLCFLGLLGMSVTGDLFNVFVFLEVSSLSTYALISMGRSRQALTASFQYLILGTIGATFFLIGVGLCYAATGSLNMVDIALRLAESPHIRTIETALGFIFVGMGLKAAMFPLHQWLPRAYTYAPMMVTAFLAGTATKVAIYVVGRTIYTVFSASYASDTLYDELLIVFGAAGIIYGAWQAMRQSHIKPLLAWSSVSQIGYLMLGFGLLSATGLMATMIHIFNHALIKSVFFLAVGILMYQTGTLKISNLAGTAGQHKVVFVAIIIAGLSLIGVPGTVGFISKWYLVLAAVELQAWWIVMVVLMGSVMAIAYVWKIIEAMYFQVGDSTTEDNPALSLSLVIPVLLLAAGCIYLGLAPAPVIFAAELAAQSLGVVDGVPGVTR